MWKLVRSNTYLPQGSRNDVTGFILGMVPTAILQVWVLFIAWSTAVNCQSWLAGVAVGLALTASSHIKWADLGEEHKFLPPVGIVATGLVSAAMVGWFWLPAHQWIIAIQVGWLATGIFNLRSYDWFWGAPGVFECREFNNAVAFILGPIYWALGIAMLALLLILSVPAAILNFINDCRAKPRAQ